MSAVAGEIRFCTAPDGTAIAFSIQGRGPPLVRVATWLTHLELDDDSPLWSHWLRALARRRTLVRYDERGCGLSGAVHGDPSVDVWLGDLEAVVDAAGLDRFALLGISQGAAIAVAYAARHASRVTHLVVYGGYARGRRRRGQALHEEALVAAIRAGWTDSDPTFRRLFSSLFVPGGTAEQLAWYEDLLRATTTPEAAVRLFRARGGLDVSAAARRVAARTLVVHARGDLVVPVEEGRLLARLVPGARLLVLDSANHILLADEPAWPRFIAAVEDFLGDGAPPPVPGLPQELSPRELEVLALVAAGLDNRRIAGRLGVSVRTVERHLSNVYVKLRVSGRAARAAAAAAYAGSRA